MAVQHRVITDPEIHEPKGAATAPNGTVYLANGSGSGAWGRVKATTLQGINSDTLADRVVLTDGAGGFKLENQGSFGTIYSNGNATNWNSGALRNVSVTDNKLVITIPGHYLLVGSYAASGTSGSEPDANDSFQVRMLINGTRLDARATVRGVGGSGTITTIQYLGVNATVEMGFSDNSNSLDFNNGSLTVSYLGA